MKWSHASGYTTDLVECRPLRPLRRIASNPFEFQSNWIFSVIRFSEFGLNFFVVIRFREFELNLFCHLFPRRFSTPISVASHSDCNMSHSTALECVCFRLAIEICVRIISVEIVAKPALVIGGIYSLSLSRSSKNNHLQPTTFQAVHSLGWPKMCSKYS